MSRASFGVLGHWNRPSVRRIVRRQKPIPSNTNPFNLSFFTPQKRNKVPSSSGSSPYARRTRAANESKPLRKSVRPHYPKIWIMRLILIKVLSSSFLQCIENTGFSSKEMRINTYLNPHSLAISSSSSGHCCFSFTARFPDSIAFRIISMDGTA